MTYEKLLECSGQKLMFLVCYCVLPAREMTGLNLWFPGGPTIFYRRPAIGRSADDQPQPPLGSRLSLNRCPLLREFISNALRGPFCACRLTYHYPLIHSFEFVRKEFLDIALLSLFLMASLHLYVLPIDQTRFWKSLSIS